MREAKNPNAKAPTKPRRLRRSDDDLDVCDGKNESQCNEAAFDGLECEPEDMLGKNLILIDLERFGEVTLFAQIMLFFIRTNSSLIGPILLYKEKILRIILNILDF